MHKILLAAFVCLLASCGKDDNGVSNDPAKDTYTLPGDTLFPEGIAFNAAANAFYTGSTTSGDILKVDIKTGTASLWAPGAAQGRKAATGMKLDDRGRLWVCGGMDTKISVHNNNGALLKIWDMAALYGAGFINDCTQDGNYIYFTDSRVQKIYRTNVAQDQPGNMEEWLTFTDAEIPYVPGGTNANGIVHTADGQYLIIVISTSGKLYRISKTSKSITEIALNAPVTAGDGLLLEGNKLYVCRNATNQLFPVILSADYTQGTVGTGFGNGLLFNTTMARAGNYFLVVNGQLNKRTTKDPVLPFSVSRVSVP